MINKIKILIAGFRKFRLDDFFRWILWRYEIIKRDSQERIFHLKDGEKFYFRPDICSGAGYFQELFLKNRYFKYYQPKDGDLIVDIGAHIGLFSLPLAFRKNVNIEAYEPSPIIYKLLARNAYLNKLRGSINTHNLGVSDHDGDEFFYAGDLISGSTSWEAVKDELSPEQHIIVQVATLEKILSGIEECDFLKMDCEGAEFPSLLSAPPSVFKKIKNMVIEYHLEPQTIIDKLESEGFKVIKEETNPVINTGILYVFKKDV